MLSYRLHDASWGGGCENLKNWQWFSSSDMILRSRGINKTGSMFKSAVNDIEGVSNPVIFLEELHLWLLRNKTTDTRRILLCFLLTRRGVTSFRPIFSSLWLKGRDILFWAKDTDTTTTKLLFGGGIRLVFSWPLHSQYNNTATFHGMEIHLIPLYFLSQWESFFDPTSWASQDQSRVFRGCCGMTHLPHPHPHQDIFKWSHDVSFDRCHSYVYPLVGKMLCWVHN